jgi:hypothetical protein
MTYDLSIIGRPVGAGFNCRASRQRVCGKTVCLIDEKEIGGYMP